MTEQEMRENLQRYYEAAKREPKPKPPKPPKPPTPAEIFVARVAKETKRAKSTVRGWMSGRDIDPAAAQLLANFLRRLQNQNSRIDNNPNKN